MALIILLTVLEQHGSSRRELIVTQVTIMCYENLNTRAMARQYSCMGLIQVNM